MFLPVWLLSLCVVLPSKVNNCDSGHSCSCPMWMPFMCGQGVEAIEMERWDQDNWLGRLFCWLEPSLSVTIISAISPSAMNFCSIPGQTNVLCMPVAYVCAVSPCYLTHSQLLCLIGYMQIGPKLKATSKGTTRGTVLYTLADAYTTRFLQV